MPWFVVLGRGNWDGVKVEADQAIRHRKGVSFAVGKEIVLEIPGHKVFRVMECADEAACDQALEAKFVKTRFKAPRAIDEQLVARAGRK